MISTRAGCISHDRVRAGRALLNLVVLWQVRRLRRRPSAAWRVKAPSPTKIRMERLQFVLSILTLILIAFEESLHLHWVGRL